MSGNILFNQMSHSIKILIILLVVTAHHVHGQYRTTVSVGLSQSFGGNTNTFTIKGTIKEDELNGNFTAGQFGTFPINAKREK